MMNIFLRLAVIVMICSWVLPDSQVDVRKRQQTYRLCSYLLTNKLSELCKGSYNGFDYGKRSAGSIQEQQAQDEDGSPWIQPGDSEQLPFRPWWVANQLTKRDFRRQKRSFIVEECCRFKGCTNDELLGYCG